MRERPSYRRGVGIMLLNSESLVFAGRRIGLDVEAWQMPQGGIEGDEAPAAAAMRELKEEVGTNDADVLAVTRKWLTYDLPARLSRKVWGGQHRGQRQRWYAMRFRGRDEDISLDSSRHTEFCDWRWISHTDMLAAVVSFKQPLYAEVFEEFKTILNA